MYGIEYQTIANLMKDDDPTTNDGYAHVKTANSINLTSESSTFATTSSKTTSYLTENLLSKLHNLKPCPDYLLPKTKVIHRSTSVTSTTSNTLSLNSAKTSKNYYTDDFILLSEFSEIEGPKPLLTIPTDGGTGFNKNEYSLHLMCVDFHSHVNPASNLNQPQQQQQPSDSEPSKRINKFNLTKDTSIINYWDIGNSVAACVHHFNLYDLEARGFVRPFCLAYVSYDRTKPVVYFEQIRTRFCEITDLLKKSNFNLFKLDLEQRCLDLKLTRDLFVKWSSLDDDLKTRRTNLAQLYKLDAKTCARLTASSSSEKTQQMQLNAIDTLLKELENVIDVIKSELKKKNWSKLVSNQTRPSKMNNSSEWVSSSQNDSSIENTLVNRTTRSLTYPLETKQKTTATSHKKNHHRKSKFTLRSPKVFTNILIGNLNALQAEEADGFCSGIDFQQMNQSFKLQQQKTMKRLQQLSSHTAREAINEMRLMQMYFSTPLYLLKFRELVTHSTSPSRNNFWSVLCGEISLANFATHIDTFNLTKASITKLAHLNKFKSPNESIFNNKLKADEEGDENETLIYSPNNQDSVQTQFYSPLTNERTNNWLINQSNDTNDSSDIEVISKITSNDTKSDEYFTTARETTWETAIEQFLDLEPEIETKKEVDQNDEDEEFHDHYDEDTLSNDYLESNTNDQDQEESEYDFVNSLMTADYKPYNQYSTNFTDIGSSSLSLSSTFTSPAIVYSAYNRCKYQPNLTDKLIQIIEFNFEETLKQLLNNYHALMPHLFYSLLRGRPVVCVSRYCDDLAYLTAVVDCLSNFVLNSLDSLNELLANNTRPKFTSSPRCNNGYESSNHTASDRVKHPQLRAIYERKPVKLNDLKYCKLFGLSLMISKDDTCCSQECHNNLLRSDDQVDSASLNSSHASKKRSNSIFKHQHKHYHLNKSSKDDDEALLLKYIPITVRNYVSIFDIDKGTFVGPKYNGSHIKNCLHKARQMHQDSIVYLYLLTHLVKHYVKIAFLYNYSILFDHNSEQQQQHQLQQQISNRSNKASRKNSLQPRGSIDLGNTERDLFATKRERIRRYFAIYNSNHTNGASNASNDLANNLDNKSTKSYYSSLSSLASSLLGYDSQIRIINNAKSKKPSIASYSEDDFEVLKVVLSLIDLSSNKSISSTSSTTSASSTSSHATVFNSSFDQHDFNIVNYLLRSLQVKQVYLYELAMKKKHMRQVAQQTKLNDSVISSKTNDSNSNNLVDNEIQFSLLVEYEELTVFSRTLKK